MTNLKVLFLDDNILRHQAMRPHFLAMDSAMNAKEAISFLETRPYDLVFLDHDLGGNEMVDPNGPWPTGRAVTKWVAINKPMVKLFVLHSLNTPGVKAMESDLDGHYTVLSLNFLRIKKLLEDGQLLSLLETCLGAT